MNLCASLGVNREGLLLPTLERHVGAALGWLVERFVAPAKEEAEPKGRRSRKDAALLRARVRCAVREHEALDVIATREAVDITYVRSIARGIRGLRRRNRGEIKALIAEAKALLATGISQTDTADKLGISPGYLSMLLNSKR